MARVFALYEQHRTPRKGEKEQTADARRIEMWTRWLGAQKDAHDVTRHEWDAFVDARGSGEIDSKGERVAEEKRTVVKPGTVAADLDWLRQVFRWAAEWKIPGVGYLMRENPVRGYDVPKVKNPRRPVASQDRYETLRAKTGEHTMEIRWNGKREKQRSYLSEILDIVAGTGRRISAVCSLRYEDLRLDDGTPHGSIRWPADTDKNGRETTVPIGPAVRRAIDRVLRDRPGIGGAYLFPSPTDPAKPVSRRVASAWLYKAEEMAGLESQKGSLWHAYRRKWVTERKHHPDADVAAAGGWADTQALRRCYQQADEETTLRVVLDAGELREAK